MRRQPKWIRRVDEKETDKEEGLSGLEPSWGGYNPLDLDPACVLPTSDKNPGVTGQQVAPQKEAVDEKPGAPDNFREDRMEVEGQQPISADFSTDIPDCLLFSAQILFSPSSFVQNCVLPQAPASDSVCSDHL